MRTIALALVVVALAGCVSVTRPENYRPSSAVLSGDYYECYRSAHQPEASGGYGLGSGYAEAKMKLNVNMLQHCMEAHGYALRKPTTAEVVLGVIFAPVWFPLALLGGTGNMRIGGGTGGD